MTVKTLTDGYFKGFRFHVALPTRDAKHGVTKTAVEFERRIKILEYANFAGAKIADLERKAIPITVDIVFYGANSVEKYQEFVKICNEGTAGILVVPTESKAYVAYAQKLSVSRVAGDVESINVSASFIEDSTIDPNKIAQVQSDLSGSLFIEKKSQLFDDIAKAKKLLRENDFINAVQAFENGLSTVRRYSSVVINIDRAIKARIVSVRANLMGTLSLAEDAISKISDFTSNVNSTISSASGSSDESGSYAVDEETGQQIITMDDVEDIESEVDESDVEETFSNETATEVDTSNVQSDASAELLIENLKSDLANDNKSLAGDTGGEADDATQAITKVISGLTDISNEFKETRGDAFTVPYEMSLMEAMFQKGVPYTEIDRVAKQNYHLKNFIIIEAGTVVYI